MDELVDALQREGRLPTPQVRAALRRVDRRAFVPADQRNSAYEMRPLALSYRTECFTPTCDHGKRVADATISSPSYHAAALEFLYPALSSRPPNSATVLDVGCGSGYLLAAFAALGARAAHGVEYAPDLAEARRIEFARARRRAARRRPRHRDDGRRLERAAGKGAV